MCISVSWSSVQSEINHLYTTYNPISHQLMKVTRLSLQEQDKSSDIEQQPPFGDRK